MAWAAPAALLVSCRLMAAGGEESFAPLAMLRWEGADPEEGKVELSGAWPARRRPGGRIGMPLPALPPSSALPRRRRCCHPCARLRRAPALLQLACAHPPCPAEFFASNIAEYAAAQGPWLQAATVAEVRRCCGAACGGAASVLDAAAARQLAQNFLACAP